MMMMFFMLTSQAQVTVDSLETLPDGSIIVEVGGIKYRGLNAEAMRNILKVDADYKLTKAQLTETERLFTDYKLVIKNKLEAIEKDHAVDIAALEKTSKFWETQYLEERKLRDKFQGIADGCSGKIIFFRICI